MAKTPGTFNFALRAIHPVACTCEGCAQGISAPLNPNGDEGQFLPLLRGTLVNATGRETEDLETLLNDRGAERFRDFVLDEFRNGNISY